MNGSKLYGTNGLFHNLVKQSRIMNGRYAPLSKGSHDLSMNNLLSGLDLPTTKYPGVFCLPSTSDMESIKGWKKFNIRLLFVCTAEGTGDNQIKYPDNNTNTSKVNPVKDWEDMESVAMSFLSAIEKIQKSVKDFYLSEKTDYRFVRFASMQNDNLNGVMVMFSINIFDKCLYGDIEVANVNVECCTNEPEPNFH